MDKCTLSPAFRLFLIGAVCLFVSIIMSGCASFQQAVNGYESAAVVNVKAAEDNNIRTWLYDACGTPFSAAIRHPEIVPGLKALCLPNGADTSPSSLFDNIPQPKK